MYYCIINPEAGQGLGAGWRNIIEEFLRERGEKSEIIVPGSPEAAKQAAQKIALTPKPATAKGLIIVGGDGTLQAVVSGLLDSKNGRRKCDIPILIVPCGSGNDFVRSLDKPDSSGKSDRPGKSGRSGKSVTEILERALCAVPRKIDAMRINGNICLNIANTGLDALIVKNAQRLKPVFKGGAYYVAAVLSIISHKNTRLKITAQTTDGTVTREGGFTLAAMCNGQYYGGGMRISPGAVIDDGQITLCTAAKLNRLQILRLFPLMLMQKHTGLKQVEYINCTACRIELPEPATLCMDGNLSEGVQVIDCEVLAGAVVVRG